MQMRAAEVWVHRMLGRYLVTSAGACGVELVGEGSADCQLLCGER